VGVTLCRKSEFSADYDPQKRYRRLNPVAAIAAALRALTQFKNTTVAEQEAFLALLGFKPR
jgi:hypothetical protein